MHYRQMFDNKFIGAWDIPKGRDATVTISKVVAQEITSQRGKDRKPVLFFQGKSKGMILNKTNCKTIARMYGEDTQNWVGKAIAVYASTTSAQGEEVECLRVRPGQPRKGAEPMPADAPEDAEAPEQGSEG